jgi:hypothetical protein
MPETVPNYRRKSPSKRELPHHTTAPFNMVSDRTFKPGRTKMAG